MSVHVVQKTHALYWEINWKLHTIVSTVGHFIGKVISRKLSVFGSCIFKVVWITVCVSIDCE